MMITTDDAKSFVIDRPDGVPAILWASILVLIVLAISLPRFKPFFEMVKAHLDDRKIKRKKKDEKFLEFFNEYKCESEADLLKIKEEIARLNFQAEKIPALSKEIAELTKSVNKNSDKLESVEKSTNIMLGELKIIRKIFVAQQGKGGE